MGELESDAHARVFRELALAPVGFFSDQFDNAAHASGVEIGSGRRRARRTGSREARKTQQIKPKLDGIFSSSVCELIDERLEDPGKGIAAGRTESVGGHAKRHEGSAKRKIRREFSGKFIASDVRGGRKLFAFPKGDEMVSPRNKLARNIDTAFEVMKAGGTIVVVMKIVFAGPKQLDGNAHLLRNGAGLEHVVVGEATAKATAGALHVHDDVVMGNSEDFGDQHAAGFRRLAGRPEFEFAVVVMREAVLRFHG